jgi:glycerol kinase
MKLFLAIDQSTSATKALLMDGNGNALDRESIPHRQIYPQPGWVEHDAEEIWCNTLQAIKNLLGRHTSSVLDGVVSISITNQRETIVFFERGTGKPLRNAIVWQCRRGDAICAGITRDGHESRIRESTGLRVDTYFSGSKIRWVIENEPELSKKIRCGEALIGTIDTYLIYRLTGGKVFATDATNASRTLLYDIGSLKWDASLCGIFHAPIAALPEVRDSSAHYGSTTFEGILAKALPIWGVIGDSQASLLAHRCLEPGMSKVTFGTGSSMLLNTGPKLTHSKGGAVSALAWVIEGKPVYALEGIVNFAAATLEWLKNQMGLITSTNECGAMAAAVPDNGGVYLVPAFAGLSAPYWNTDARAAIVGLSAHSTRNHIVRAAVESIAYQLRDLLEMMQNDSGLPMRQLHGDGGPTRDAFLMNFTADMLGIEMHIADMPDCSALGAVMAGMVGQRHVNGLAGLATIPHEEKIYRPSASREKAEAAYEGWKRAVKRVL